MNKIYINTNDNKSILELKDKFDLLYNTSAITIEGLSEDSIIDFINWIKEYTQMESEDVYIINGKTMNEYYHLSGTNAYSDDLTIVSIPLDNLLDFYNLAIHRFEVGARWFDDIVDNNRNREKAI